MPADEAAARVLVEDVQAQLAQAVARHLGELHLQLHLLVADDVNQVRDLLGVQLGDLGGALRARARRTTSPESTTRSPAAETEIFSVGEELEQLRAQAIEVARHQQRETSGSSFLFQSVRSVDPTPRDVSSSCVGVITFRSAIFGSATETRPIGSDSMQQPVLPGLEREVLHRADLAIDADGGRRWSGARGAASAAGCDASAMSAIEAAPTSRRGVTIASLRG